VGGRWVLEWAFGRGVGGFIGFFLLVCEDGFGRSG